jgi:hypothetical protein
MGAIEGRPFPDMFEEKYILDFWLLSISNPNGTPLVDFIDSLTLDDVCHLENCLLQGDIIKIISGKCDFF